MAESSVQARVIEQCQAARVASRKLARASAQQRNLLLKMIADKLRHPAARAALLKANAVDLAKAEVRMQEGTLSEALVRRLVLTESKLDVLAQGLLQLSESDDPVGRRIQHRELEPGLVLEQKRVPLGVLGVIFESRPDAVPQIAGLGLRTGNAVVLKGGKEASQSNLALTQLIQQCLQACDLPTDAVTYFESREHVAAMLGCQRDIDLLIARGSGAFVEHIMQSTKIPVLGHAEGLCHILLDSSANPSHAASIVLDAKTSYPAACNAVETLLWVGGSEPALKASAEALLEAGVELRLCPKSRDALESLSQGCADAQDEDWATEYTDTILSIKYVADLNEGLAHIEAHGSKHTEAIVTDDVASAQTFFEQVDAACVFHNASTRFADGYRLGIGAEVGISTSKLHARGPVGIDGLLSTVWHLRGQGQASTDFGTDKKTYTHRELPL